MLHIFQWTGENSVEDFGELLLQVTKNPGPEFIALLWLIGQSVNHSFFIGNETAFLEALRPDQSNSFCHLFVFLTRLPTNEFRRQSSSATTSKFGEIYPA
jgi:hypothetical protein